MRATVLIACLLSIPSSFPLVVYELDHRPHEVSADRWGGDEPETIERRLEAVETFNAHETRRLSLLNGSGSAEFPLFEGIGTHYAFVYVGTPPQRVSVIIDTGSHHTVRALTCVEDGQLKLIQAFPCSGCKNCGRHTDPYFDPHDSSTNTVLSCSKCKGGARCQSGKCVLSQSYTEGSSWKATQMQDKLWVGGISAHLEPASSAGQKLAVPFLFGCQYSETGLFRTQKADGIMGLSGNPLTLIPQVKQAGLIEEEKFALCFMKGSGIMSVGGTDKVIHQEPMKFVPLTKASGWFTVKVWDLRMDGQSIGTPAAVYNSGKGVIVDSGTTDTYLPKKMAPAFKRVFKARTGRDYANTKMTLAQSEFESLPTLEFVFHDSSNNEFVVHMRPDAYMEHQGSNRYVPRVYLTEASGAVLGANFMQDHDVLFDEHKKEIGFARSDCNYENRLRKESRAPKSNLTDRRISLDSELTTWQYSFSDWVETQGIGSLSLAAAFLVLFGLVIYWLLRKSRRTRMSSDYEGATSIDVETA